MMGPHPQPGACLKRDVPGVAAQLPHVKSPKVNPP
jgi:hypothetical protein